MFFLRDVSHYLKQSVLALNREAGYQPMPVLNGMCYRMCYTFVGCRKKSDDIEAESSEAGAMLLSYGRYICRRRIGD